MRLAKKPCAFCQFPMQADKSQCPSCKQWQPENQVLVKDGTVMLHEVPDETEARIETGPLDECFGGGTIRDRVYMIGGSPGAGKSTIALQILDAHVFVLKRDGLYIGVEESGKQIKTRAKRLGLKAFDGIRLMPMGAKADIGDVIQKYKPSAVVLDSVAGLTRNLDEQVVIAQRIKKYATVVACPVFIINQISKDADFAGKMELQHAVDALYTFYPDDSGIRTWFVEKDRDAEAQVKYAFEMKADGLHPIFCSKGCGKNAYACACARSS